MSVFKAGILALTTLLLLAYFGFSKANPFANPYELKAMFRDVESLKPRSPVRIAGVEVGKVTKVEPKDGGGAAEVTMELKNDALPIREDARLQIRSRIFLEGNFFVDIQPGSPSSGELEDGSTVPITQTAATVTLPDILDTLDSDVRTDLQSFLYEYGTVALEGGGAKAFNRAIPSFQPAYRYGALTNDALLGVDPDRDIQRLLKGQQKTFSALGDNPQALKELVTDLNTTAGAIARNDEALEAAVPALRDTLRVGSPALAELNAALPTLRTFSREALPGVRSSVPALAAATPWFEQARGLVQQSELKGLAADLRQAVPRPRAPEHAPGALPGAAARPVLLHEQRAGAVHGVGDPEHRGGQLGPLGARADQPQLRGPRGREPRERREHARVPRPGREPVQAGHGQDRARGAARREHAAAAPSRRAL